MSLGYTGLGRGQGGHRGCYLEQTLAQGRGGLHAQLVKLLLVTELRLDVDAEVAAGRAHAVPVHIRLGLGLRVTNVTVQHLQTLLQNILQMWN